MPFEFDVGGWYIGGTAVAGPRTVPTAPTNKSTDDTPGAMRANWTGTAWVNAPYVPPTPIETEPQTVAAPRIVSVLGFRRRFTPEERAAIEWAAVDRPDQPNAQRMLAAALRATLADQAAAKFIDLDDDDTAMGVQGLEAMGLLAAGRAAAILGAPVKPHELP